MNHPNMTPTSKACCRKSHKTALTNLLCLTLRWERKKLVLQRFMHIKHKHTQQLVAFAVPHQDGLMRTTFKHEIAHFCVSRELTQTMFRHEVAPENEQSYARNKLMQIIPKPEIALSHGSEKVELLLVFLNQRIRWTEKNLFLLIRLIHHWNTLNPLKRSRSNRQSHLQLQLRKKIILSGKSQNPGLILKKFFSLVLFSKDYLAGDHWAKQMELLNRTRMNVGRI
mmetsp:Transcript_8254/g.9754  ORF Transcript_8254/g.9754 Transcript_8254/m.9754 type:complete len:225 (-) Transcript_8254:590-1264(-)